jgi:tetratricopeptide (TPR) repeat protein
MKITTIKYILFFLLLTIVPTSMSAQKDVRTNIRKGNKAYNQQRFSDATTFYENAISENGTSKEAVFNLGNTLYRQGEWDGATEQFQDFLSLERENPLAMSAAWHNIGNIMLASATNDVQGGLDGERLQNSLEAYKMALRMNPQDDETRYNLAVVQRLIHEQEQEEDDDSGDGNDDQQEQQQDQQQEQNEDRQQNQNQQVEQTDQPEQMSRENARQLLQAIEQDERETQERVQRMRAAEREQQAENNRRNNRNW